MALLGFYHDSSLFTSPVTSIYAGAPGDRHCERECTKWGTREDRGFISVGHVWVQTPGRLHDRRVLYILCYAPRANWGKNENALIRQLLLWTTSVSFADFVDCKLGSDKKSFDSNLVWIHLQRSFRLLSHCRSVSQLVIDRNCSLALMLFFLE